MKRNWAKHILELSSEELKKIDEILKEAGYVPKTTIFNLEMKEGYIKKRKKGRFHIFLESNCIELHLDKTVNGKHKMQNNGNILNTEIQRIASICKNIIPKPKKEKRKFKDMYAPNLIELQRNIQQKKPSLFKKILKWLS